MLAAAALPLMLSGCLWGPGKFTSNLALNKSGHLRARLSRRDCPADADDKESRRPTLGATKWRAATKLGEPELVDTVSAVMLDDASSDDDEDEADDKRPCTAAEIAKLKVAI